MQNKIIIYNTQDGKAKINLRVINGSIWLNQLEIAELFDATKQNISKHIKNIFNDNELDENATVNYQLTVQKEGTRQVNRKTAFYNLDMILAIGYRVRSPRGMQFRNYATTILKEYLVKGFVIDDERLKNLGGGDYFKELLEKIRDIRSSEKVFYRQVLDIFATSVDYDSKNTEAVIFFKTVQNKIHYAIHNQTASELIFNRVDSNKTFMGLTNFKGELPTLKESKIAKNYLSQKELTNLNTLVSGILDFAERQANKEIPMTMKDWLTYIDKILLATGENLLNNSGKISHDQMLKKVEVEYKKFKNSTLSQVEKDYLNEIKNIENLAKQKAKNETK
ncbi:virulence RhuM family protein [Campylobacter ureolyticus]|uniref:virulence RhuM family protein n=1 Tax=Campylobacter ureolyticus TaxID=827 RepID=UPI0022B52B5B|nr:virulence RhuM family protein [Campylobacter ureolyticus]MCZ6112053.1 virulence RhuM family protein [Campylobacter ureolyticus]MCZ6135322.1 virulence RhuM family protein [Campylobacter ureolyticus]MDK8323750.1 virulence RhuM family protein [Campylobacter ureolyticus]